MWSPIAGAGITLYRDAGPVTADYRPLPHHLAGLSYTASGYGAKIPTPYMIGRRRVYATLYGNAGTMWIMVNGEKEIVR